MARLFSDPPVVPRRTPEERRALRLANNDPAEHVNALYASAQDAYRALAAARSEAA